MSKLSTVVIPADPLTTQEAIKLSAEVLKMREKIIAEREKEPVRFLKIAALLGSR